MFDWIAFDADDTLWKNEETYLRGRVLFTQIMEKYSFDEDDINAENDLEVENISFYGYGVMSFVLSLIELGIQLTEGQLRSDDIQRLLEMGKTMLGEKVELYQGVEPLLENLSSSYQLMLITKGDMFHQQRKLTDSGLKKYFSAVEYLSEKNPDMYQEIFTRYQIDPSRFLMIGNSLRSDILPVLDLGGGAVHLSGHLTWSHEDNPFSGDSNEQFISVEDINGIINAVDNFEKGE